ncbi:HAMP domain-containing protein [Mesobacillus foraminis]|uniref:Methyl-accepting chemotaxis protein n=1 Tax=Mesobacillus foraminis TaxID=279826 RepID=A0A4V2RCX9_9BACI|nr:methyl-accepting chemotaxis protein [Mesobacillus foraminis]TCN22640.1 methyl-accepting chemotaxis protein [Mesobacillus foraminis]
MKAYPKISDLPLRKKLILVFMVILFWLATINCVQIALFFGYLKQYSGMMETITLTNSINGTLKQKLDAEIRDIAYGKVHFENGSQYDHLNKMYQNLDKIELDDKEGQFTEEISEVRETLITTTEYIDKLGEQIQINTTADERNITYEYITILTDIIDTKVQSLLQKTLLVKGQSENAIAASLKRDIIIFICSFIGVVVTSLLFAIYISGNFVKPIRSLGQKTNEIAEGNLTIGIISDFPKNEMGDLCRSYNRMFQNLKDIILNVRKTNDLVVLTSKDIHQSILENQLAGEEVAEAAETISVNLHQQDKLIQKSVSTFEQLLFKFNGILVKANKMKIQSQGSLNISTEIYDQMNSYNEHLAQTSRLILNVNNETDKLHRWSTEMNGYIQLLHGISKELILLSNTIVNEVPGNIENERLHNGLIRLNEASTEINKISQKFNPKIKDVFSFVSSIKNLNSEIYENNESKKSITEQILNDFQTISSIRKKQGFEMESIKQDMQEAFDQMLSVQQIIFDIEQSSKISNKVVDNIVEMGLEQLTTLVEVSDASSKLVERIQEMKDSLRQFKL